jgi:uncharacterized membrane protein
VTGLRFRLWWAQAFWVIPILGLVAAMFLADFAGELDDKHDRAFEGVPLISGPAATTVLSAVGGGMVTFTGFVFSLILLLLQFGSSQYSPRTVAFFLRARSTQVILALFLANALFCFLAVLGTGSLGRPDFSPVISVIFAMCLLFASLVAFVILMHLVAKRIRIDSVVTALGEQGRKVLVDSGRRLPQTVAVDPAAIGGPLDHGVRHSMRGGQVVAIDYQALTRLSDNLDLPIALAVRVGDSISPGVQIARTSGDGAHDRAIGRCIVVYGERSLRHDPLYSLRILVDIALKALSPAVNDPTTAVRSLSEIDGVLRIANSLRWQPITLGRVATLTIPVPTWEEVVDLAIREIRLLGLYQPQVTRRMSALLLDLLPDLSAERQVCVRRQLEQLRSQVALSVPAGEVEFALTGDRQGIGGTLAPAEPAGLAPDVMSADRG